MTQNELPLLITFDGEARSGKGTIVQAVKDVLRDEHGYRVMLIDTGQVFRCLVVAAKKDAVDVEDPAAIDAFLADNGKAEQCVQFVKDVYRMDKAERDALLYTNDVSADSAKIGARPLSQSFKDELLKKWLRDAGAEGYEIVLLDGRALEEAGQMLEDKGLCRFVIGLYFICDPTTGARRTLGHASKSYNELSDSEKTEVDTLVAQIIARNEADKNRAVQPIAPPKGAPVYKLPAVEVSQSIEGRVMATIDTSAEMTKQQMYEPVIRLIVAALR